MGQDKQQLTHKQKRYMKPLLNFVLICLLMLCASCGKLADKEVTISYVGGKKPVRLGDYYWSTGPDVATAVDSKMDIVGVISKADNSKDYYIVQDFTQQ